jgi:lysophospholipase L1-like esterase
MIEKSHLATLLRRGRNLLFAVFLAGPGLLFASCDSSPSGPSGFVDIGTNDPGVVLASGDSVTYGIDSSDRNGYRRNLELLLAEQGRAVTVVNGGRPGTVSGSAYHLLNDLARFQPAVVVLQFGVNDASVISPNTAPGVVANLRGMIYAVQDNMSIAVLTTLTPTCGYRVKQNTIIGEINEGIRELALEFEEHPDFVLADVAAAFNEADPAGGGCSLISSANFNHPNDAGYLLMATVIADAMEPLSW